MACLEHECRECDHLWMNNVTGEACPKCGSPDVLTTFDEPYDDYDEWDDEESEAA